MSKCVLSIQSHVVHGYVGNKIATFPLQVLGFDVDTINTVQLSNHTGYKSVKGQKMNEKELDELFQGIVDNDLHKKYSHLLTGYVGTVEFLKKIVDIVSTVRKANPNIVYLCDPVMGDNGRLYVPETFIEVYRDELIPIADIVTPNQYEAELLTGIKIKTEADAWNALEWFHKQNVKTVCMSSSDISSDGKLMAFVSQKQQNNKCLRYTLSMPKLGGINFTGTGDLFAALFLAHISSSPDAVDVALEKTAASLQAVIRNTLIWLPQNIENPEQNIPQVDRELRIIQSRKEIECPIVTIKAVAHS